MQNTELLKGFMVGLFVMFLIALTIYFVYTQYRAKNSSVDIQATTILKSVEKISKLMVVEGNFSEVYSYEEKTKVFFNLLPQEKKALIILHAKVQIGYDLKKVEILVDKESKQVIIKSIPKEEINIIPDIRFYDIQTSTFTSFSAADINKVQKDANDRIQEEIEKSDLKNQARQRLTENLESLTAVSQAMGWKMVDKANALVILPK
jgi:hypothetical protein